MCRYQKVNDDTVRLNPVVLEGTPFQMLSSNRMPRALDSAWQITKRLPGRWEPEHELGHRSKTHETA